MVPYITKLAATIKDGDRQKAESQIWLILANQTNGKKLQFELTIFKPADEGDRLGYRVITSSFYRKLQKTYNLHGNFEDFRQVIETFVSGLQEPGQKFVHCLVSEEKFHVFFGDFAGSDEANFAIDLDIIDEPSVQYLALKNFDTAGNEPQSTLSSEKMASKKPVEKVEKVTHKGTPKKVPEATASPTSRSHGDSKDKTEKPKEHAKRREYYESKNSRYYPDTRLLIIKGNAQEGQDKTSDIVLRTDNFGELNSEELAEFAKLDRQKGRISTPATASKPAPKVKLEERSGPEFKSGWASDDEMPKKAHKVSASKPTKSTEVRASKISAHAPKEDSSKRLKKPTSRKVSEEAEELEEEIEHNEASTSHATNARKLATVSSLYDKTGGNVRGGRHHLH